MTLKQIIMLLVATTLTGLAVTSIVIYLWNNDPQAIGLEAPLVASDTLKVPTEAELLKARADSLSRHLVVIRDSLANSRSTVHLMQSREQELRDQLRTEISERSRRDSIARDSSLLKNMQITAEMYERAQPAEVAKILAGSDAEYCAGILRLMKRKSAAKVLDQLPTAKAIEISKMLAKAS